MNIEKSSKEDNLLFVKLDSKGFYIYYLQDNKLIHAFAFDEPQHIPPTIGSNGWHISTDEGDCNGPYSTEHNALATMIGK